MPPPYMGTLRLPPALFPAGDTPTDTGNALANLSVYTHDLKTHTDTKEQAGVSTHVFDCEYVYRLLYVRGYFVGALLLVARVWLAPSHAPRPPPRSPNPVTSSGGICTSRPCHRVWVHKCVLCLSPGLLYYLY